MPPDIWSLYSSMLKSRLIEEAIAALWHEGSISGEMHLGTGEEAVIAGVVAQIGEGDAMALDHRGTAALVMRGVDPRLILRELLGRPDGLCGGQGGHMHLFSKRHLAASSGIVGSSGPAVAGFALAADYLRPGSVAVGFFGEGAMNQGMLMESLNLAAAWNLPALFVCKDDGWSITVESKSMTAGELNHRAEALGVRAVEVDGTDVSQVWEAAHMAVSRARTGGGPTFLHAYCVHLEAHFLGLQLVRAVRNPLQEMPRLAGPLTRSLLKRTGARSGERMRGLKEILAALRATFRDPRRDSANDPIIRTRDLLRSEDGERLADLETSVATEVANVLASVGVEASS